MGKAGERGQDSPHSHPTAPSILLPHQQSPILLLLSLLSNTPILPLSDLQLFPYSPSLSPLSPSPSKFPLPHHQVPSPLYPPFLLQPSLTLPFPRSGVTTNCAGTPWTTRTSRPSESPLSSSGGQTLFSTTSEDLEGAGQEGWGALWHWVGPFEDHPACPDWSLGGSPHSLVP